MKKVIALVSVALLIAGSAFAMDLSIALKGLSGGDNSGVEVQLPAAQSISTNVSAKSI